jgi:hypothetical protein
MQVRYINRALQRFDSTQVIPTQFVLFTLAVIIGSAVLYRDFESITAIRATKFVGGCLLTFLGVYFITSGRVRADNESSFSSNDEEGSIGLLNGERYHDRIDLSPPGHQMPKTSHVSTEAHFATVRSPPGSLLSQGIEGVDEERSTPRGILSASLSSHNESLTAESPKSGPSFDFTSPLRPPSRMSNPWEELYDQPVVTSHSDDQIFRPSTPTEQGTDATQSTVLLQFPPAPGIETTPISTSNGDVGVVRRASTPTVLTQATQTGQTDPVLETPSRRALRNSISHRFSPGPLLPTLSGGFTAVVADSIRRGDGSPLKDRSRRRQGRRRQLDGAFVDPSIPTDGLSLDTPLSLATARLQSATHLADTAVEGGRSTPALATETYTAPTRIPNEDSNRLRSLSDSWGGGLAWLGGALRKSQNKTVESAVATQGTPTPENETPPGPSNDSLGPSGADTDDQ